MPLKVKDIKNIIEGFAPVRLKESYDNVGLMVGDLDAEVTSILIALDCTLEVIEEAIAKKCSLIITHHPLLFIKPSTITTETLTGKKVIQLIKNNINLYSAHTNLDSVEGGINDSLMKILGFEQYDIIEISKNINSQEEKSGIGRIAVLNKPTTLLELSKKIKETLELPFVRYSGKESLEINKVAIINGSGQDYFHLAKKLGVDCIITGDTTYHYVSDFREEGIGIIDAGHFGTEWLPYKKIGVIISEKLKDMGFSNQIIFSNINKEPYNII
ncbi:putative GTP cyclohydrolase 1 type 2 [Clostridium homopropionicum DSM 5847]|uniref:GTP cyclohydrolase 1 type 2 homolog n=1 Tax=Clostridium homopropionicum DSM 5847 TaxID=1121318 RepID=A0A0L6ZE14_9CLOT|nr:Nif3-like dinuclear metal center hexameric protein [Clostridium homopropionicum]KOA21219.1 putative GTP cyclohydrolase 1 type 2 [Clostridium homopropionicum DSM 5847]SFG27735.1 dinuclear metal center protein, YbgI/SA1388 family [Clostridium homopropionicum]